MPQAIAPNIVLMSSSEGLAGEICRVLWIPAHLESMVVITLRDMSAWPYWVRTSEIEEGLSSGDLICCPIDPSPPPAINDEDLTTAMKDGRNLRWTTISSIATDPERKIFFRAHRVDLVRRAAADNEVAVRSVQRWLRKYWQFGQVIASVTPQLENCGGRGKIRVCGTAKRGRPQIGSKEEQFGPNATPETVKLLQEGAKKFLPLGVTYRQAFVKTLDLYFGEPIIKDGAVETKLLPGDELPTERMFRYYAQKVISRPDIIRSSKGQNEFDLNNRPVIGTTVGKSYGPGSIFQIDSTAGDVYLLSTVTAGRLIGRPVIYFVLDHYSERMVGFSCGLKAPSWEALMLALENAMTDKVEFCARYGVKIVSSDFPDAYPDETLTDRGPDNTCDAAATSADGLNIKASTLPPRRPDYKALVEHSFGMFDASTVDWIAGSLHGRAEGSKDHRLDATYTMSRFIELMITYILKYNRTHRVKQCPPGYISPDGRDPTPNDLWDFGVARNGLPRRATSEFVRAHLLKRGVARETRRGLRFKRRFYTSPTAEAEGWFVDIDGRKWRDREISWDERDVGSIWLILDGGRRVEQAYLTGYSKRFSGLTQDEVEEFFARRTVGNRTANVEDLAAEVAYESTLANIKKKAEADRKRLLGGAAKPSVEDMRTARAIEGAADRKSQAWTKVSEHLSKPSPEPSDTDYVPAPSRAHILARARNAAQQKHQK